MFKSKGHNDRSVLNNRTVLLLDCYIKIRDMSLWISWIPCFHLLYWHDHTLCLLNKFTTQRRIMTWKI